jgi:hypothetical protein
MASILPSLLLLERFVKQQKRKGVTEVHSGGSVVPLSVLLYGISTLRNIFGSKQPKTGKVISPNQVKDAIKIVRSVKIGSGLKIHYGGFILTLAAILSAIGALAGGAAGIIKAVHDKQKNDAELEEMKRHHLAMEAKTGSSIKRSVKRKTSGGGTRKRKHRNTTKNLVSLPL